MKNLSIESISIALFFTNELHKPNSIFQDLNDKLNFLNGTKMELPDLPEMPAEVPRLILKSIDNEITCQISKTRIDLSLYSIKNWNETNLQITDLMNYILGKQMINRFGLVGTFFYESDDSVNEVKTKYFNNSLTNINELSIRYNKPFKYKGFDINDVVSIEAGVSKETVDAQGKSFTTQGILIVRDLNNLIDPKNNLHIENLLQLYQQVHPYLELHAIESLM